MTWVQCYEGDGVDRSVDKWGFPAAMSDEGYFTAQQIAKSRPGGNVGTFTITRDDLAESLRFLQNVKWTIVEIP
jgi:hypothetical protein